MIPVFKYNWRLHWAVGFITFVLACGSSATDPKIVTIHPSNTSAASHFEQCELGKIQEVLVDTLFVKNPKDLEAYIQSNRVLLLENKKYEFQTTLKINNIENLKIIGSELTELGVATKNATVLALDNSRNISIQNLQIGHSHSPGHTGEQGVLRIEHSTNIQISNSTVLGAGTFGLIAKDVCNLKFENSKITKCSALIFELNKSRKITFENSVFHDNNLSISVLGGFTNSTKEVSFVNCSFLNNQPHVEGNPVFNFNNNYQNFEERIIFKNCTFKNNKGYKWYGDKIRLESCTIDSTDFINLSND